MKIAEFFLCAMVLAVTVPAQAQSPAPAKVKVVATFSILGDLVQNVGGDHVDVSVLVGPDSDVHTFEPSPQDNIALSKAQVIFENGLYLEPWLEKLYGASGAKARRVVVSDGVEPIEIQAGQSMETDPHIWHDVANAMIMVEHIRDALIAADGAHAGYYKENAENYLAKLGALDQGIIETLKDIPDERRRLVTSHDTFGYFARRYHFTVVGAAIESATTEAADPSAAEIAQLVEKIKKAGVSTVFIENTHNPKLLQAIAAEAKVNVAPALYTDALGRSGSEGDTYMKMIRHNAKIFAQSL